MQVAPAVVSAATVNTANALTKASGSGSDNGSRGDKSSVSPGPVPTSAAKKIKDIKVGDLVASRNPRTGATEYKKVLSVSKKTAPWIVVVSLADKKSGKVVQSIEATGEHPFFTPSGMVSASRLGIGTEILTRAGPNLVVQNLERKTRPEGIPVYNFEVEDDHTYFVGNANGGAWVHMSSGSKTGPVGGKWGKQFLNKGNPLPTHDAASKPVTYSEHYLRKDPTDPWKWGSRRMLTGSDGRIYYTHDHYGTFYRIR